MENENSMSPLKMAILAPFNLITVRDRKESAVGIFEVLTERNPMKKIPSKLDEKWKFYEPLKMAILAPFLTRKGMR